MDFPTCIVAVSWGGVVGAAFLWLVRRDTILLASGPQRRSGVSPSRRLVRWGAVSGALFVPALWGTAVVASLVGFDVARRLLICLELRRGD